MLLQNELGVVFWKYRQLGEWERERPRGVDVLIKCPDVTFAEVDCLTVWHLNVYRSFDDVDNFGSSKRIRRDLGHRLFGATPKLRFSFSNPSEIRQRIGKDPVGGESAET